MSQNVAGHRPAASHAVRSIRDERAPGFEMRVRRSETVRDGLEANQVDDTLSAETAVLDPATGRYFDLTARQMTAIHLLIMGKSVVATAESLGIGVSTLHRWKSKQPAFVAELNRRKREVFERTIDKLRSTMAKAVDELHTMMNSKNARDRYEVAMKLLPLLGPRKWIEPTGPTDAEGVVAERVRERRQSRGEETAAEVTEAEKDAVIREGEDVVTFEERQPEERPHEAHSHEEHPHGHPEERSDEGSRVANRMDPPATPHAGSEPRTSRDTPDVSPSPRPAILRRCAPLDDQMCGARSLNGVVPKQPSSLEGGSPLPPAGTGGTDEASRSDAIQHNAVGEEPSPRPSPGVPGEGARTTLADTRDDPGNVRTHADGAGMRPGGSSFGGTGIPACDESRHQERGGDVTA